MAASVRRSWRRRFARERPDAFRASDRFLAAFRLLFSRLISSTRTLCEGFMSTHGNPVVRHQALLPETRPPSRVFSFCILELHLFQMGSLNYG